MSVTEQSACEGRWAMESLGTSCTICWEYRLHYTGVVKLLLRILLRNISAADCLHCLQTETDSVDLTHGNARDRMYIGIVEISWRFSQKLKHLIKPTAFWSHDCLFQPCNARYCITFDLVAWGSTADDKFVSLRMTSVMFMINEILLQLGTVNLPILWLAVWLSGNVLTSINVVGLRWTRLVPRWVTVCRRVNYLSM